MSFRVTGVLLFIFMVLGGYMVLKPQTEADSGVAQLPWFYIVEDTNIRQLDVEYYGENEIFVRDPNRTWRFGSLEGAAVGEGFGGTPFLAAGARSPRIITQEPSESDLAGFGLADPKIKLRVHMDDGRNWLVLIGGLTADRVNNYAQVEGFDDVYLLDRTWGEHMAKLITEPPVNTGESPLGDQALADSLSR